MADVTLHVDGEVSIQTTTGKCMLINISKDLTRPGDDPIPYGRDTLYLMGSVESFRDFARKILAALPAEPEPECTCEQTDVDRFDARGCELHAVAKSRAVNSLIVSDRPDEDLF